MTDIGDSNFEDEFGLDVQKKFIGLLLRDKTWAELNGFDIIKPEYFQNKILKLICKWIHDYHREYKDFPTKLVLSEQAKTYVNDNHLPINEYFLYTTALDDIFFIEGGEADIEFFKNKAITFVRQQAWKAALGKGTDALKINNYQEAIDKFREVLTLGAENDLGIDYSTITPEEFISVLGETYDKSNMIQTGIEAWDDALGGGFVKDNVHLLGACLLGKVKIKTNKGLISIEELSKLDNYNELEIYSFDGQKKIVSKIQNVFETKKVKKLINLKFNNGKSIQCTLDHKFVIKNAKADDPYIIYEKGIAYKEAQYLTEEDEF